MRIIMMGTGPFAVPTFSALLESAHEVVTLVTRPARPIHGKSAAEANPMRDLAERRNIPVLAPESINAPEMLPMLQALSPRILVVCDYGQILAPAVLSIAPLGGINLHGSLLPAYRGAAPINWAIYNGDLESGVTVIHMTPQIDAGPAIFFGRLAIGPDDTAADLEPRLSEIGAPLVLAAIDAVAAGTAKPLVQDPALATKARRLRKTDGEIDWTRSAQAIKNQIRALQPWPMAFTFWQRPTGQPLRVIVEKAQVLSSESSARPGTVIAAQGNELQIATGERALQITAIQPAGKRVQTAAEFLRGYPVKVGEQFGSQP